MATTSDAAAVPRQEDQPVESLYLSLRAQILTGQLSPGSALSQVKLADAFGVGRTPLREALRMLQREGLIQAEFNRMIRVSPLSTGELEQIYARRIVLEAVAIRASTVHFTPADIDALNELLTEMESYYPHPGDRITDWERPHRVFHELLIRHSGAVISEDLRRLRDHGERYRAILGKDLSTSFEHGAREHREIVEAVQAADGSVAGFRLAEHLAGSGLSLIAQADPTYDSAVLREALLAVRSTVSLQDV